MGATKEERSWTDRPVSGRVPASTPVCIGRLLAIASEAPRNADRVEVLERMLDVLLELEPRAAAAVWFDGSGSMADSVQPVDTLQPSDSLQPADTLHPGDTAPPPVGTPTLDDVILLHRASVELVEERRIGEGGRVFPELAEERIIPLNGPVRGNLHLAVASFENATREAYELLLHQAASVFSLAIRSLEAEQELIAEHHQTAQLEKLSTIGQTAASIIHELNNPLTAIVAYSDFLERRLEGRGAPQTDLDRLRHIGEAAARIQHFCRELTDYSRPSGRFQGALDMHELIDRALSFCMHGLRDADITVERIYRDVPMVIGIEAQLTQVFVNLITNAWQAMSTDGGTLRIATSYQRGRVCIEVHDEGHGIPEEVLPRIFDSYFTTKPRGEGVGLGLSIVRSIITDHGGVIKARAGNPGGTVFVLELPVAMSQAP